MIWFWMYEPAYGIINRFLAMIGISGRLWLHDEKLALASIIIMSIWKFTGYYMVIYLAGLQGIPEELKEAARIDGCGPWRIFLHVTLPLLMPTTFFVLVLGTIRATQNAFAVIYVMTSGGPVGTTNVIVLYLYEQAFSFFRLGYASAVAYVLFVFVFGVTLLQFYFMRKRMEIYK